MIVLDASAAVDLLLGVPPRGEAIAGRLRADAEGIAAPHLLDAEVAQVLRRFVLRSEISADRAIAALDDLRMFPLTRYPHVELLQRAFELRDNVTVHDALYLALAERLGATLVTCDSALSTVPGHAASVVVV